MALAASGMRYREIVARFNTTRNAICGLVFRQRASERARQRRAQVDALALSDDEIIAALELRFGKRARFIVEEIKAAATLGPLYQPPVIGRYG